jgi:membrane-bound metal-dependent hydrolase YbcI (DUF457 family)
MIYGLIFSHWVADFILQSDWMAKNKSKDNFALLCHIGMYSCALMFFAISTNLVKKFMGEPTTIHVVTFVFINGVSHFVIDYFTSRASSKLWVKGEVHKFFVVIGFDQALHMAILYGTFQWLLV